MAQDRMPLPATKPSPKPGIPDWRWLLAPMLLASLGLHGLILFVPMTPSDEELVPPPDPEEDGVAITKIDAPQPRTQATAPANAGAVRTAPPAPATATPTPTPSAPPARSRNNTNSATPATAPAQTSQPSTDRAARPSSNASGQTASVPNFAQIPSVDNPNAAAPSVGGRATSGDGRLPIARANPEAASGPDSFERYIEVFETYNGVKIAAADATEIQTTWLGSLSDRGAELASFEITPLQIAEPLPYESDICLPNPPESAQLLVLVDADGTVAPDTYQPFIQRTGYRIFDNAAADALEQHEFPTAESPTAYLAEFAVDYDDENCQWPPQVDKLPNEYFTVLDNYIGPTLTTPAEARTAQENWLQGLSENADVELASAAELTAEVFEGFEPEVPYPLEICLPLAPKDAEFGVVVQPDGSLSMEPVPLRSTGYQNFDDRAKELVTNFAFPEADTTRLLVVEVPVDYNSVNCQPLDADSFEIPTTAATRPASEPSPAATATDAEPPTADSGSEPPSPAGTAIAFDPALQSPLLEAGRQRVEADPVGSLNTQLEIAAASLELGWPDAVDQNCFLADLTTERFEPVEAAADAIILSESADFVPLTLSRLYQTRTNDAGEYCGAPLLQMTVEEIPQLFASTIPFGSGGANALVVLWTQDPREN